MGIYINKHETPFTLPGDEFYTASLSYVRSGAYDRNRYSINQGEHLLTEHSMLREFANTEEETKAIKRLLLRSQELPEVCHELSR